MKETNTAEATATAADLQPIPGLDALGFGYDVRDQYASAVSIKLPIIDVGPATVQTSVNGRSYLVPENVVVNAHAMDTSTYDNVSGDSLESYRKELNTSTNVHGKYNFYSGSLAVDFDQSEMKNSETQYSTIRNVIDLWTLNLPNYATVPVLPAAQADIDGTSGMAPMDVLKKYGSHFIQQGVIGGRANYASVTDKMLFDQSFDLGVSAEMSYKTGVGSITASETMTYGEAISSFDSSSTITITTQGGDPTQGGQKLLNGNLDAWVDTVPDYPVLIDFTQSSLVEIWMLCADPTRQSDFIDAYAEYMKSSSHDVVQSNPIIEVQFTDQLIEAGTDHDSGAKKDMQVWRPAISGDYQWVGQYAQPDHNPSTGTLAIVKSLTPGSTAPPTSFVKVWDDHGGSGNYSYSCWRPVPPVGYVALGYIMRMWVHDNNAPSGSEIEGLVCVHESLVVEGQALTPDIWDDHGTGADHDCSIFSIIPIPGVFEKDADGNFVKDADGNNIPIVGINAGTYYGQEYSGSHVPNPTHPQVYCLNQAMVDITNPDKEPKS